MWLRDDCNGHTFDVDATSETRLYPRYSLSDALVGHQPLQNGFETF